MKIIHGTDYYDHAHCGVDPNIVFVRDGAQTNDFTPATIPFFQAMTNGSATIDERIGRGEVVRKGLFPYYMLSAGVVYPAVIRAAVKDERDYLRSAALHCELKDVESTFPTFVSWTEFTERRAIFDLDEAKGMLSKKDFFGRSTMAKQFLESHFKEIDREGIRKWAVENGIVTGLFCYSDRSHWTLNSACLKAGMLHTHVDAFTMNQNIAGFIGGEIMTNEARREELSDKTKILKAGFDLKSSFRKSKAS